MTPSTSSSTQPTSPVFVNPDASRIIDRWQLGELIDESKFTAVYRAKPRTSLAEQPADYVLKALKPEWDSEARAVSLLTVEAFVGKSIKHPNLTTILSSRLDQPTRFVVMPYIRGRTLASLVKRDATPNLTYGLWTARQVAQALMALHAKDWCHGDVTPSNILVSRQGHATLIDLGMAYQPQDRSEHDPFLAGTLEYTAPEMFVPARERGPQSDVYSLGVTLYEATTGQLPFSHSDPSDLAIAHLQEEPPEPRSLNPLMSTKLGRLLKRMLAKEPLRRPTTDELVKLLTELEIESFGQR